MEPAEQWHFFDYSYAVWAWDNLQTKSDLDTAYMPCKTAFEGWHNGDFARRGQQALDEVKTGAHPEADAIKRCRDLRMAYEHWSDFIRPRLALMIDAHGGIEALSRPCQIVDGKAVRPRLNDCGATPDWRSEKQIAADEKDLAWRKRNSFECAIDKKCD